MTRYFHLALGIIIGQLAFITYLLCRIYWALTPHG